ncbi:decapping mRNA 1 isoform X2 [Rhodnius prolixus]|uniref:decapping mRNA 1 isoform X2 n=1 Tax=Rhodnius prolixus TaxID=13249 RepID=UPI003D18DBF5
MAKSVENNTINVSAIKLADPYLDKILERAAHVALYNFNANNEWEKTDVEGALFLYSRTVADVTETKNKKVMDFFAKAGSKTPSQSSGNVVIIGPRAPPPGIPRQDGNDVNPLLQRLISNPVQTVEQIEKQHTALRKSKKEGEKPRPTSLSVTPQGKLENGLTCLRISESPPKVYTPLAISTQHFFNQSKLKQSPTCELLQQPQQSQQQPTSTIQQPLEVSLLERSVTGFTTPTKPALLPPGMFTTPREETRIQPEPLTKTQLLQAVSYLLKNDADFINKLHEAYVKSFVDMVS